MDDKLCRHGSLGVAMLGKNLELLAANPAFCGLAGYHENEIKDVFVEQMLDPKHVAEFRVATSRIFSGQIPYAEIEQLCITKQGHRIPVAVTLDRLDWDKAAQGRPRLSMLVRDLSYEKQQSEETRQQQWFLQTTFDTIDQGVTIYDRDFRLVAWNKRYQSLNIFPPEFLKRGTYLIDAYAAIARLGVFGPGNPEQLAQSHIDDLVQRKVAPREELRSLDGNLVEIRRYLLPEGGLAAVFSDITDQRNAEDQLRQSQKMQAIGQLTGGIAHDFNNLLAIIIGNIELIADQPGLDKNHQAHLDEALKGAARASNLTHRLLAFSRRQTLNPSRCKINDLVTGLMEMLRRTLGEKIQIEVVVGGGVWDVMVDRVQLENAIINMAINARDAMPAGGTLTIETSNSHLDENYAEQHDEVSAGRYVMLAVSDTGTGIANEHQNRIFEPFFSTKESAHGCGLGLSMVYGFVKQSGGHIKVYSEFGHGSTFKLYLPKCKDRHQDNPAILDSKKEQKGYGESILVVEDEAQVRDLVQALLTQLNYSVQTAPDGHAALELLRRDGTIDLLLTDVVLPRGINGNELARSALQMYPDIKILYMSGYTESAIVNNGNLGEEINLIGKPFQKIQLAQRIRYLLDQ